MKNTLVVIAGPTAVGKTAAAIEIAKQLNCEIISADSRQFYRELNIGTAKPGAGHLKEVKHHFINNLSLNDDYNAGKFETEAAALIENKLKVSDYIILTGGSGLYIDAVLHGFDTLPEADRELRTLLQKEFESKGIGSLQRKLNELDAEYYKQVDMQNPQRLIRALEVCILTGKTYSSFRKKKKVKRPFKTIKICLNLDRKTLYERINKRVDEMINAGLVDEVKNLSDHFDKNALHTVGYNELISYLTGKVEFETAVELIKRNTRRYAKRQLTWFRRDSEYKWFAPNEIREMLNYIRNF